MHKGIEAFQPLDIKIKEKIQLMIIDVLYTKFHLGVTRRLNGTRVDIEAGDTHTRKSCLAFTMK